MTIRQALAGDAAALAALSIEVWIGTYLKQGVSSFFADYALETFTAANLAAQIADPSQVVLVSDNAEGIDGFIRIAANSPAPFDLPAQTEIATFYVQPRHHGKGIGRTLLRAATDHCRAAGITAIWLTTNAENSPAIAFYLARGFVHHGTTFFQIGDQSYPNNLYVLDLELT